MAKGVQINLRLDPESWYCKQLKFLAEKSNLPVAHIARDLLYAALAQTSDNPPKRKQDLHLELFNQNSPDS